MTMRITVFMVLGTTGGRLFNVLATKRPECTPPRLIIDTDAGFDVDDMGALCIANALADRGETTLIAAAHTNAFTRGVGALSAVMTYYGRGEVPLGAYKGAWASDPDAGSHPHHTADRYVSDLARHFPATVRSSAEVRNATDVYRQALAQQPNHSVHLVSIGITTNMRDLVRSAPDRYSPLTGFELIAQKVAQIVWVDGTYNFGCAQSATFNWLGPDDGCRGSAKIAIESWPGNVQQIFTNVGGDVLHGAPLATCTTTRNPCRQAFQDWGHGVARVGRMSWDPIAVLVAVRGAARLGLREQRGGYNTVDTAGREQWVHTTTRDYNQSRLRYHDFNSSHARHRLKTVINQLLCRRPLTGITPSRVQAE